MEPPTDLKNKKCLPCEKGTPKMTAAKIASMLPRIPGWEQRDEKLFRKFKFKNFAEAMKFVNAMAGTAEGEGHHPDFTVHYSEVDVAIWTHAIGGLSENDFILAAKIGAL